MPNWFKKSQTQYFYHETKRDSIGDIAHEGIIPMSYGQSFVGEDHEMMSPEMLEPEELENINPEELKPRTYFMRGYSKTPMYGDIVLRFPATAIHHIAHDVDEYTFDTIPPNVIEVFNKGQWIPIQKLFS